MPDWVFNKVLPTLLIAGTIGLVSLYIDVQKYVSGTTIYRSNTSEMRFELKEHLKDNRATVQDLVIRMTKVEGKVDTMDDEVDDMRDRVNDNERELFKTIRGVSDGSKGK